MRPIIIRPRHSIPARDPDSGNARVDKDDAEERKTSISRRGWGNAPEDQPPVGAEALDQRAGFAVSVLIARPAPIRQINVREDRTEPGGRRRHRCVATAGHEELRFRDITIDRAEEPLGTERLENGHVGLVVKGFRQAGEWSLYKPCPRCGEEGAAICEETGERRSHDAGCSGAAAVPVDLAATVGERPGRISVVGRAQSSPVLVDRVLYRGDIGPGRLEHDRYNEVLTRILLCESRVRPVAAFSTTHHSQPYPEYGNQQD